MNKWYKVRFNVQNIITETDKAVLIQMPHSSAYDGFKFWHPAKLIRDVGDQGDAKAFSFTDSFKFKLFKNGQGKYNKCEIIETLYIFFHSFDPGKYNQREIIDQKEITAKDMIEAFR